MQRNTYSNVKMICAAVLCGVCLVIVLGFTSGCAARIDTKDGYQEFREAIEKSLEADIYYWKEVINRGQSISRKMNVYGKQDKDGTYLVDVDGKYIDYSASYVESVDGKRNTYLLSGSSVSEQNKIDYAFGIEYDDEGKETGRVKESMSVNDFLSNDVMEERLLDSKLFDLGLLEYKDMNFNVKASKCEKNGYLTTLQFAVREEFFTDYETRYGKTSVLKGEQINVEIIYGKIYNVTVYRNAHLDDKMTMLEEDYRLNIVYMGPIEKIPDYNERNNDDEPVWQDGKIFGG